MSAVLVVTLATALVITYASLVESARDAATGRLASAARQLGSLAGTATAGIASRLRATAERPSLGRALASVRRAADTADVASIPEIEAARAALAGQLTPADSLVTLELWTADGRRVVHAGREIRTDVRLGAAGSDTASLPLPRGGLEGLRASDSVQLGPIHEDGGVVFFWAVAPVTVEGRRAGYLARRYAIADGPRAEQTVRGLTGAQVSSYYRALDGSLWSSLGGRIVQPPDRRDSTADGLRYWRSGIGEMLAVEEKIAGAPLVLALELPVSAVLTAPRATVMRLALISVLLTAAAAVASWIVSRRIARPLGSLTAAAEAIARGDLDARVKVTGEDELGRLGSSFNRMAEQVSSARTQLELRTEEAEVAHQEAERARAQAEAANQAKSEFLAVMSHELRTPLNAIGGYAELMEMELRGPLTEAQRIDLGRIRANQQHLLGLIGAVLDLSRIESGYVSYDLERVPLGDLLDSLESLVGPQAAAKSLTLEAVPSVNGLEVVADREKLRQILLNLLSNAIRYTLPGGRIALKACAGADELVRISVCDTGVGIAPDAMERIFEPFVQLDRTLAHGREGVGLGLAISRDLARGMGGDLSAASEPGQGSTFTVTLPVGRKR